MPGRVLTLKVSEREAEAWRGLAASEGLAFNAWARRELNDALALERALAREAQRAEKRGRAEYRKGGGR